MILFPFFFTMQCNDFVDGPLLLQKHQHQKINAFHYLQRKLATIPSLLSPPLPSRAPYLIYLYMYTPCNVFTPIAPPPHAPTQPLSVYSPNKGHGNISAFIFLIPCYLFVRAETSRSPAGEEAARPRCLRSGAAPEDCSLWTWCNSAGNARG